MSEHEDPLDRLRRVAADPLERLRETAKAAAPWTRSRDRKAAGLPRLRPAVAECGTRPGARRHRRLGEPVCEPCLQAERDEAARRYRARRGN